MISSSRVRKIPDFSGRLSPRPLYVYLPPGYDEDRQRRYPVLYMHDGQNCFEAFVADSGYGVSWRADEVADWLITQGLVRPFLIVGVTHGGDDRIAKYLPPYARYRPDLVKRPPSSAVGPVDGRADQTLVYYRDEVNMRDGPPRSMKFNAEEQSSRGFFLCSSASLRYFQDRHPCAPLK